MASLEAALMGEKKHNYCSSDEEEADDHGGPSLPPPNIEGGPKTGPKGVLNDYHEHIREQKELRALEQQEKTKLINQLAPTVKPRSEEVASDTGDLIKTLEDDTFMQQYRARRLLELKEQARGNNDKRKIFGNLTELRGDKYADVIDSTPKETLLIIHVYDEIFRACQKLNYGLARLAKVYPTVRFCRVQSYQLELSRDFQEKGLPALLVYKGGNLVGNLLRVTDQLGEEFSESDIESFLLENHCLPTDAELRVPELSGVRGKQTPGSTSSEDD